MNKKPSTSQYKKPRKFNFKTDTPLGILALLALIAMPRVVIHDLKLLPFDSFVYLFTAIVPMIIYLVFAIVKDTRRPIYDFLVFGVFYGIFLALIHFVLWDISWANNLPALGDNLKGVLDPGTEATLFKIAAIHSSIVTGVFMGLIFGLIALASQKVRKRRGL